MASSKSISTLLDSISDSSSHSEEDWDDYFDPITAMEQANKAFPLVDYIESKFNTQATFSSKGWNRKMFCPFHKNGHERTPSLYVNCEKNIFYCQACGVSGGLVQFISNLTGQSENIITEHILKLENNGDALISRIEAEKKLEKKRKVVECSIKISDLFRNFIQSHVDDEQGLKYIDKLMSGFDNVFLLSQEDTESNIEEIYKNFETYIAVYDKKAVK